MKKRVKTMLPAKLIGFAGLCVWFWFLWNHPDYHF